MNIFNSLGSNYNFSYVVRSLRKPSDNSSEELKKFLGKKYGGRVVLTYKGRQTLELALKSLRLEENSKVAVTGFTCIAVIEAIEKNNLTPVYLDIDPKTLNFDAGELESRLTSSKKIRAVIIQNTLGYPCDIEEIQRLCKKHKIVLIEDLAHSIGSIYSNGKEAGTVGDFVCLSFSQDKAIDAVSGGALIVKNAKFKVQNLNEHVVNQKFSRDRTYPLLAWIIRKSYPIGLGKVLHFLFRTFRILSDPMKISSSDQMSEWHAGLALYDFQKIEITLEHRRKIAQIYADNLPTEIVSKEISAIIKNGTNLRFPIFLDDREKLVNYLKSKGVHISDVWYDSPVAPVKYLGLAKYPKHSCPNAEKIADQILNLPTHVNVSEKDARQICRDFTCFAGGQRGGGA